MNKSQRDIHKFLRECIIVASAPLLILCVIISFIITVVVAGIYYMLFGRLP